MIVVPVIEIRGTDSENADIIAGGDDATFSEPPEDRELCRGRLPREGSGRA